MSPLILTPLILQVSGSTITIIFLELTHASSHMTKSLEDRTTSLPTDYPLVFRSMIRNQTRYNQFLEI